MFKNIEDVLEDFVKSEIEAVNRGDYEHFSTARKRLEVLVNDVFNLGYQDAVYDCQLFYEVAQQRRNAT